MATVWPGSERAQAGWLARANLVREKPMKQPKQPKQPKLKRRKKTFSEQRRDRQPLDRSPVGSQIGGRSIGI